MLLKEIDSWHHNFDSKAKKAKNKLQLITDKTFFEIFFEKEY